MNKKTWIWPISWYFRIRELEAENAALRIAYKDLDAKFRAEMIANTMHNTAMMSAMMAMAADEQRRYAERASIKPFP
jgi:hypothetical protein